MLGATGYVGGRLVPKLLESGYSIRAGVRYPEKLACRSYGHHPQMEITPTDVMDFDSLSLAMQGCQAVYYLVHSMLSKHKQFATQDKQAAVNTAKAAHLADIKRIIYLGGLGEEDENLSEHLSSRREVGRILQQGPVPTTYFRAAAILGSGSASFEMIRYLVERLPVMITPRWVQTLNHPIAISNVLEYLVQCLEVEETQGKTFDICGPDLLTYRQLFGMYAQVAGLTPRLIIPLPFLTPRLSSYWIHLVTPVPASIARPLAEGLRNKVVCRDNSIQKLIPQRLLSCQEAIQRALNRVQTHQVESCWSDAGDMTMPEWIKCGDPSYAGGTIYEGNYRIIVQSSTDALWQTILKIGGENGWYFGDQLWKLRGFLDRLIGGVGLRRGRRNLQDLRVGDALDFWRVLVLEPEKRLQLVAEMRLPGEATLEFTIEDLGQGRTELREKPRFFPKGLLGIAYWYALLPFHDSIFKGMLREIATSTSAEILHGPEKVEESKDTCSL